RERARDPGLLARLRVRRRRPGLVTLGRELSPDDAAVHHAPQPFDQPGLLEPVEPVRHGARRELELLREFARLLPERLAVACELAEHAPLAPRQVVRGERLLELILQTLVEPLD